MRQYAMEGAPIRNREPGRLYASFPVYDTLEEVRHAARMADERRPDLPPVRLLVRDGSGAWRLLVSVASERMGA